MQTIALLCRAEIFEWAEAAVPASDIRPMNTHARTHAHTHNVLTDIFPCEPIASPFIAKLFILLEHAFLDNTPSLPRITPQNVLVATIAIQY